MTKEELQSYYDKLDKIYRDSIFFDIDRKGKNQKIRDNGDRNLSREISHFKAICESNSELYILLFADNNPELLGQGSHERFSEATSPNYFVRDFNEHLKKLTDAIEEAE